MKKTILILITVLIVSFFIQLQGQEKKKTKLIKPMTIDKIGVPVIKRGEEESKRERYSWARNWKTQKHARHQTLKVSGKNKRSNDFPNLQAVSLVLVSSYSQSDSSGNLVWTGRCKNTGTTGATYVRIDIDVYNSHNVKIGSDYDYVWGGTNVRLVSNGEFTNAIRQNEEGFFRIWTNISYAAADSLDYSISYEINSYNLPNASLDFTNVYYTDASDNLNFYGDVKNLSTSYVTYYTIVAMAAMDTSGTYVLDVDWNYVDGDRYNSSTTALYPQTVRPFDIIFPLALFDDSDGKYRAGFEWDEAATGPDLEYPFGAFETPTNNSTVSSSIAVTGWALDDTCVASVKIYRENAGNLVYIGDATFVDGARPDIAAAYPDYPLNTAAGWGYMMLTNFLPGGGNGYFVLHAIAQDVYGDEMDLGSTTIYCNNDDAVKPFGAIDTPTSGGTASGNQYQNIGWALTPPPNKIPTNGSTIGVYVDGVKKGNATYNLYREDIATLFPGYLNSNGAMATFKLNTLNFSDGLHTIYWIASDNAGNADGIGSRYFNVANAYDNDKGLKYKKAVFQPFKPTANLIAAIPPDSKATPVLFKKGYRDDIQFQDAVPTPQNIHMINIHQLERVELQLPNVYAGYLSVGDKYKQLPVGSTLDTAKGMFYWQPGPAFLGEFNMVFILKGPDGELTKKNITIAILKN